MTFYKVYHVLCKVPAYFVFYKIVKIYNFVKWMQRDIWLRHKNLILFR